MTRASPGVPSRPDGRSREAAALQVIRVPCSHCVRTLTEGVIAAHKTPANEALLRTRTADPLLTIETFSAICGKCLLGHRADLQDFSD